MNKTKISITAAIAWVLIAHSGCRIISNYYYPGDMQVTTITFDGYQNKKSLFIGFWILFEMKQSVNCPFLTVSQSDFEPPEIFEIRTETESNYAMYANGNRCFAFRGSSNNESFFEENVARRAGTFWNYFSFNYLVVDSKTMITYAVYSELGKYYLRAKCFSFVQFRYQARKYRSDENL
jgi:hypothetical protein